MNKINFPKMVTTLFGLGFLPLAPGTWGSLAGLMFCVLFSVNTFLYITFFAGIFAIGVKYAGIVEKESGIEDPSFVIIDEFACIMVAFFLIPITLKSLIIGFVLFRLFDIIKIFPMKRAEKIGGGWGIMLDDLIAGIYANLILRLILGVTG
jgi:phosphatidylglycerophosphatase A